MRSLPCSRRKSSVLPPIIAAKAEPETLRQLLQWHSSKGPLTPAISKRTPPHKQLPLIMQPPIGSSSYLSPARHNDFHSGRLTSGANRGLAFTRPEPHNEQRILPYLIGGQPWHRVAHFLWGWMSIRRRSQWRMWPRSGRLKSSPWARLAPGNVTSTR